MALTEEFFDKFKNDIVSAKTYKDLMGKDGPIKQMIKAALETMLHEDGNPCFADDRLPWVL